MATKRRKRNTALVYNPAGRSLAIGGARVNPSRRRRRKSTRRRSARRRNPVVKVMARRRNPIRRRRRNPITSTTSLIATAFMAGIGVSLFDVAANNLLPASSAMVRTGVKLGGAYAINTFGRRVPILGKYKTEIALVLLTSAAIDVMKLYILPLVTQTAAQFGLGSGQLLQVGSGDGTTGNIYGNAFTPDYQPYS